jgi:anthranilate phosphoribosyltransferase
MPAARPVTMTASQDSTAASPFPCARFIKEIGRGPHGARALSAEDTFELYRAMLDARVSDVELGAILIAYRLKGETADELAAMLAAAQASFEPVHVQDAAFRPVSIPSYNGARKQPNLVPLLALLLAREGVPVLVHGVERDPGRVTSAEIFAALSIASASSHDAIEDTLAERRVAFAPIDVLAPRIARLLSLRAVLGVRNSTHTLVKILQPFAPAGLRLVNYTHPPYRDSLAQLFREHPEAALGGALPRAAPKARRWPTRAARCRSTGCTTASATR